MSRLNRYKVTEIWWLSGIENFVREMIYIQFVQKLQASEEISE